MPDPQVSMGTRFAIDIAGANAGYVKAFDGLQLEADIVTSGLEPENIQKKHVAAVRWTPAKASIGIAMGKEMYGVIQRALQSGQKPFDGTLYLADFNYRVQTSLAFAGGILTEVAFPKLDGSSKEAGYFDLEWDVEAVRWLKGDNSEIRGKIPPKQKTWLSSNFRFEMGGLPCNRVAAVQSFTWKCSVEADQVGSFREPTRRAGKVTVPNIKVEISMADYDAWAQEARKWFIDGQNQEQDEMAGAIVLLGPDMKTEIGRVTLKNCGFAKFTIGGLEGNSEKAARFSAEFYVEAMEFTIKELEGPK